jgi:23S rRNA (guanosine2251-2'-O)-methyltransferase
VLEALRARGGLLRGLYVLEARRDGATEEIRARAKKIGIPATPLKRSEFPGPPGPKPQGVAAIFKALDDPGLPAILERVPEGRPSFVLALDHVADPGNLGALLRSALAFGADAVITPKDRAAGLSPGALKAAQGAYEHLPFLRVGNLNSALKELRKRGYWLVGAQQGGPLALPSFSFPKKAALVLGQEHKGLSRLSSELCDFLVGIPMAPPSESLNVSVAGALFMYACRCSQDAKGEGKSQGGG